MSPNVVGFALLLLGVFLLLGKFIRLASPPLQRLFLPSSIIGGVLALLLGPEVLGQLVRVLAGDEAALAGGLFPPEIVSVWRSLPGLLISVVFATLFLGQPLPNFRRAWRLAGPQLALGVTLGAGQYVVGIGLAALVLTPLFGLPPLVGALVEVGFEGGHGTAAGLGDTFATLGFPEGADLALGLATVGIIGGIVIGIALINWWVRSGRAGVEVSQTEASKAYLMGIFEKEERRSAAEMTVRPASIEPLAIHAAITAVAILVGVGLLEGLRWLEALTWGAATDVYLLTYVPLFPLAMIGGIVVQRFIDRYDRLDLVDRQMMVRIQGFALDLLIVAALAALSLTVIGQFFVPFVLLALAGVGWNLFVFLVLAPRIIPEHWFERAIGDFGQSMGVTATGLILMRIADPDNKTPAYEAFGYKQLAFEPFFGGGLVTGISVPLIAQFGPWPLFTVMSVLVVVAVLLGLLHFGRRRLVAAR
jgi:ESS family glutamate:Na+ symporter